LHHSAVGAKSEILLLLLISISVSGTSNAFGIWGATSWGIGAITSFPSKIFLNA
jgi:hypothetical protein